MSAPVIGRVEFAPYVAGADALKREQERTAALLSVLREILALADVGCGSNPPPIAARVRKLALDAIAAAK